MDVDEFVKALDDELNQTLNRLEHCVVTPKDVIREIRNAVAAAKEKALHGFTGR